MCRNKYPVVISEQPERCKAHLCDNAVEQQVECVGCKTTSALCAEHAEVVTYLKECQECPQGN